MWHEAQHANARQELTYLFRGKCLPADVLVAAKAGTADEVTLAGQLFYAHLYLGLWFDATGKKNESKRYIDLAADEKLKTFLQNVLDQLSGATTTIVLL